MKLDLSFKGSSLMRLLRILEVEIDKSSEVKLISASGASVSRARR